LRILASDGNVIDGTTLAQLQKLCGNSLPEDFLRLMSAYPEVLKTAGRSDDQSGAGGVVADVELLAAAESLLEINREVRLCSLLDPEGQEFRWPQSYLVIGETGDGDYYCIDTAGEDPGVLQFLNQPVAFESVTDSLEEFVEMLMIAFTEGDDTSEFDEEDGDEADDRDSLTEMDEDDESSW
jgi:hypothetical protein